MTPITFDGARAVSFRDRSTVSIAELAALRLPPGEARLVARRHARRWWRAGYTVQVDW